MRHVGRIIGKVRTALGYGRQMFLGVVAVVAVMVAAPLHASAASQVPFEATFTETVTGGPFPCPTLPVICFSVTGTGQATHLGATSESMALQVDTSSPAPDCSSSSGGYVEYRTSTLTAANGDQITLAGPGTNCRIDMAHVTAHDSWQVIAGTGKFSGATGSGTNSASIHDWPNGAVTAVTTFSGTISSPGSVG